MDFTTAPSEVGIVVERLPQVVNGFASRFSTSINEYTDLRLLGGGNLRQGHSFFYQWDAYLKYLADSIEEPSMGIDLLLVLGLQNQDDLDGHEVVGIIANRQNQLRSGINRELCGIL